MSLLFGDCELDQERRQLLRSGQPVPLEPKAYELLSLLLERRPRALSKAQIRDVVWPQTFVSESALAVAVNAVREALGDDARHPRFIRTVHGFGYAFCGEARSAGDGHPGAGEASDDPKLAPQELKEDSDSGRSQVMPGGAKPARRSWRIVALAAAFVLLPVGWYEFSRHRTVPLEESLAAVPVTSLPGVELHPALSPDARRVAFVWDGPDRNNFDVYVKEIGSEEMVRVTKDPAPDYHPVWSPDGRTIAFLRRQGKGANVVLVPAGGGQEQRLAEISECPRLYQEALWAFGLDWSPDGRFLAASDRSADARSWGIDLISVETGEKRALTTTASPRIIDRLPAFSPDGRTLAFLRGDFSPDAHLFVQPLSSDATPAAPARAVMTGAGIDLQQLGENPTGATQANTLSWMPGGQELVMGDQRVSPSGSRSRPRRFPARNPEQVSIRRTRLVFSTPETRLQLLRVSLAGVSGNQPAPFLSSTRGENSPAFSPDGRRIALRSYRSGEGHIWVCNVDGSGCHALSPPQGADYCGSPSWSPDGRRLAFDAGFGTLFHVYISAPEGGILRPLTSTRTYDARPRWSRDGQWIYFASTRSGEFQVWKTRADSPDADRGAIQVTRQGGIEAAESPDGRYLYYANRHAPGIWRLSLGGPGAGREEEFLDIGGEGRWSLRPDGMLVLDDGLGRPPAIRFVEYATRRASEILALPADWEFVQSGGAFAVSPDGQWAIVNVERVVESDIMLVEGFR